MLFLLGTVMALGFQGLGKRIATRGILLQALYYFFKSNRLYCNSFNVARVSGDFSPRASRPSGALAAKGDYCVRLSLKNVASQSSFSARREIPQTLRA